MLGDKIKKYRKSIGMTQQELAIKVGYNGKTSISEIEKGKNDVPTEKLSKIAQVLGVSVSDLLEDNKKKAYNEPYHVDTSFLSSEEQQELKSLLDMNNIMFMKNGGLSENDEKALKLAITKAFLQAREEYHKKNKKWYNMQMSELIEYTLRLKNEYNSNINALINNGEHNIKIEYIEDMKENKSVYAYNFKMYDTFYIFLNPSVVNENNKDFVIAHELAHILLHDENMRTFSNLIGLKTDKLETQANLFATYFLGYEYRDCDNNDDVQKAINYIHCNFKFCDLTKTM